MTVAPPGGLPFHRLARTARHAWWRPVVGLLVAGMVAVVGALLLYVAVTVAAAVAGRPDGPDGAPSFGPLGDLATAFASIALLLPAAQVAVVWVQRRPAGSLSSVLGRLRWRWLLLCLLPAAVVPVATLGVGTVLLAEGGDAVTFVGWEAFLSGVAVLLLVVPAQAAAEEYVCRGYLLQAVGAFLRRPWVPILVQAVVFSAIHGLGTPWGFANLVVFGALAGLLTVRTGGLEAAIALHVMNNLAATVLAVAMGQLTLDQTAADMPWQMAAVDVAVLAAYTLVALRLARRRGIAAVTPAGPDQPRVAAVNLGPYPGAPAGHHDDHGDSRHVVG
jgi:membrane protease YdiL (CAAX protease family)